MYRCPKARITKDRLYRSPRVSQNRYFLKGIIKTVEAFLTPPPVSDSPILTKRDLSEYVTYRFLSAKNIDDLLGQIDNGALAHNLREEGDELNTSVRQYADYSLPSDWVGGCLSLEDLQVYIGPKKGYIVCMEPCDKDSNLRKTNLNIEYGDEMFAEGWNSDSPTQEGLGKNCREREVLHRGGDHLANAAFIISSEDMHKAISGDTVKDIMGRSINVKEWETNLNPNVETSTLSCSK